MVLNLILFAQFVLMLFILAWLVTRFFLRPGVQFFNEARKQGAVGKFFFGFISDLFKILATGAFWLFFALFIHISMSVHQDMGDAPHLRALLHTLEPLQAEIAAQLEANAARDTTKGSPQLTPEMILDLTRRFPDLSHHHVGEQATDQHPYQAILLDGSITVFSPRAAAFFLLRPVIVDGKVEWSCHASGARANILPYSCRTPLPAPSPVQNEKRSDAA